MCPPPRWNALSLTSAVKLPPPAKIHVFLAVTLMATVRLQLMCATKCRLSALIRLWMSGATSTVLTSFPSCRVRSFLTSWWCWALTLMTSQAMGGLQEPTTMVPVRPVCWPSLRFSPTLPFVSSARWYWSTILERSKD
eukprot:Lithocolla_globosa_v1_NODE_5392_length_1247_cov_26.108221.p2 type:complete len:138 gc:universal NODE_5392_length_1247_cov_26.108221:1042-629(-)